MTKWLPLAYIVIGCMMAGYAISEQDGDRWSVETHVSGGLICGIAWPIYLSYKVASHFKDKP